MPERIFIVKRFITESLEAGLNRLAGLHSNIKIEDSYDDPPRSRVFIISYDNPNSEATQ